MFSEKYGYKPQKKILYEEVSQSLRNRIWNLFYQEEIQSGGLASERITNALSGVQTIESKVADRLGFIVNTSGKGPDLLNSIQTYVTADCNWYELYDFIDIHLSFVNSLKLENRIRQYNTLLEQEKSGYRVVCGEIAPITDPVEIQSIESATQTVVVSVNQHIRKALELYADTKSPDYENSVKESISAVEAMCCTITGMTGSQATLGAAIKKLKDNGVHIHGAMEKAFLSLYGYTSDENGIRHGGIDFKKVPAEDAKFMLVSCSSFVNYLIEKWSKGSC